MCVTVLKGNVLSSTVLLVLIVIVVMFCCVVRVDRKLYLLHLYAIYVCVCYVYVCVCVELKFNTKWSQWRQMMNESGVALKGSLLFNRKWPVFRSTSLCFYAAIRP